MNSTTVASTASSSGVPLYTGARGEGSGRAGRQPVYAGLRVTILGMARQGMAATRFFLAAGADVTVSDLRPASELLAPRQELERYVDEQRASHRGGNGTPLRTMNLRIVLGDHPMSLLDETDLLCLSGGVSPAIPIVQRAKERGIPLTNDAQLTLLHCPVPVIGVTGSAGKTTTTTLASLILEESGFSVHLGGNIGTPLLDKLDTIVPGGKVVMELSSFQTELISRSPSIAALLNITPNHLDRHPSMSHYAAAKANVLRFQAPGDTCVLNADDPFTGPWLRSGRCKIEEGAGQDAVYFPLQATRLAFSLNDEVPAGAFLQRDRLIWRRPGLIDLGICRTRDVRLRGRHNLANILASCCLAGAAGADLSAMARVATTFGGVEHRLEPVRQRAGVLWVNDSIATAPERTVAALRSFDQPIILLAGGRDKQLPWEEFAAAAHEKPQNGARRVRHIVLFGEAADLIGTAVAHYERDTGAQPVPTTLCADLSSAVAAAAGIAHPGDVVLLAPGGTSFDAYEDFAARGRHFRELVEALP
jgi:UDP-N-acetylmuramoylalanine--D-glutamate ligase